MPVMSNLKLTSRFEMSKTLIVNNTSFNYPTEGEPPGWGQETTGWAEEVTNVLGTLQASGDILQTTFSIPLTGSGNVSGLLFDTGVVRSAEIKYSVYRTSTASPSGSVETGVITLVYDNSAPSGQKWLLTHEYHGNSFISFNITDAGQITYSSLAGPHSSPGYSGTMKFYAKVTNQ